MEAYDFYDQITNLQTDPGNAEEYCVTTASGESNCTEATATATGKEYKRPDKEIGNNT